MRSQHVSLILILVCLAAPAARAQETQVPLDSAGKIEKIDLELEQKLGLFPEFKDFQEARLYQGSDSSYALEILYLSDGRQQRNRKQISALDVASLRQRVTERIRVRSPQSVVDQEGRGLLVTGWTILGLGYYGPGAVVVAEPDDAKIAVALYMFTAASGFFIPYLTTQNSQVTMAQADLSLYGATFGAGHGHLLYAAFGGEDYEGSFAVSMVTGIGESIAGYYIAGRNGLSEGKVSVLTSLGTFGLGFGAGATFLLGGEQLQPYALGMLVGSGAGFIAGNVVANSQNFTAGDATVMSTAGAVGAFAPFALLITLGLESHDGKPEVGLAMAGAAGGLALGNALVKEREFSSAQGNYVALGTAATTAVGLGLAYLLASDKANYQFYTGAALLGSVGGFALMYSLLEKDARDHPESRNWNLDISPTGIGAFALGRKPAGGPKAVVPLASFQYRF